MPIGILALLPQLIPVAAGIIARLFPGTTADKVGEMVAGVVAPIAGGTDEVAIRAAAADPEKVGAIMAQLAQLALQREQVAAQREAAAEQARLDTYKAALGDTANARQQTAALAAAGSPISWGAPIVSLVITLGFFGSFGMLLMRGFAPDPGTAAMLNIMVGSLAAGFAAVVGYWLGSSAGSARKDVLLAATPQQQSSPIATTGDVVVNPSPPGTTADDLNAAQLARPRVRVQAGSTATTDSDTWTPTRAPTP